MGTVDGANIEIGEETGPDNIFLFGTLTPEVEDIRYQQTYVGQIKKNAKLETVIHAIQQGRYGFPGIFEPLLQTLNSDYYLVHADFEECK